MNGHRARTLAAAVPLILINAVAFAGQLAFLRDHLPWPLAGQVTMAVALESIAVFLALHAHAAALADDSALRLRLASYAFAAVIGAMNYSHYALPGWRPTFPAAAVGLMSASSPWLWAVHSRRMSRDALLARGLVEPHALRLGMTRWLWHPLRAGRVMWLATWDGVTDPREAVAQWDTQRGRRPAVVSVTGEPDSHAAAAVAGGDRPALPAGTGHEPGQQAEMATEAARPPRPATARPATRPRAAAKRGHGRRSPADTEAAALAVLSGQPHISGAELGRTVGVSERTGRRLLATLGARSGSQEAAG